MQLSGMHGVHQKVELLKHLRLADQSHRYLTSHVVTVIHWLDGGIGTIKQGVCDH